MKLKLLIALIITLSCLQSLGQYRDLNIDPKWKKYYECNPSGIEQNYKAVDFIKIIEFVNFKPQKRLLELTKGDPQFLKKILLMLDEAGLRQMKIEGSYYSITFKHDDYFTLYNLYYTKIDKKTWDKYCPYLLPLMILDGIVKLN